jgi:hypothetical protein
LSVIHIPVSDILASRWICYYRAHIIHSGNSGALYCRIVIARHY